jgi:hypothetical protein
MQIVPCTFLSFSIGNSIFDIRIRNHFTFLKCIKFLCFFKSNKEEKMQNMLEKYYQEINDPFVSREKYNLVKKEIFTDDYLDSPPSNSLEKESKEIKNTNLNYIILNYNINILYFNLI